MKSSTQHLLRSEGGGVSKKVPFPLFLRATGPSTKHACFLECAAWNNLRLAPFGPTSFKKSPGAAVGPPAPGPPEGLAKVSKNSFRDLFKTFFQALETFSRLFPDCWGVRGDRGLSRHLGPSGPE